MKESKIVMTHRLQKDGRWAEASLFKDELIAKLRGEGKPRKEAQAMAWEAMGLKYPPEANALQQSQAITELEDVKEELPEGIEDALHMLVGNALWCLRSLGDLSTTEESAPSEEAWRLLGESRQNPDRLLTEILPRLLTVINAVVDLNESIEDEVEVLGFELSPAEYEDEGLALTTSAVQP